MKSDRTGQTQYAALPWRREAERIEVMLLTSRETRRWVIPKGWPMHGCAPAECAAQEAFEEGGVRGEIAPAIGAYRYDKELKDGTIRNLTVEVYPLQVGAELPQWPEAGERERRWFAGAEAAAAVDEPDLADLIRTFSGASAPPQT